MTYLNSLRLRAQIALGAEEDPVKQAAAIELASRDPIFFIENFCWTFDPRQNASDLPFILYEYQREYVAWLVERIEAGEDGLTDKSRDMGATYTALCVFLWYWRFRPNARFLIGSRKEDLVDGKEQSEDDAPLFKKLDYNIDRWPAWFLPKGFSKTSTAPS
jgi:phage terminase large subunit